MAKSARPASLLRVLILVVVSFGGISVLQFLHLGGSVESASFVCFLQETVVDVWENGKRRPSRIAKPYLDPVIPKNSKDPHCNRLYNITILFLGMLEAKLNNSQ